MMIVANYHYVRDSQASPHGGIHALTRQALRDQLSLLGRAGTFVGQADLELHRTGQKPLPERAIMVTFDDGLREQAAVARPLLQEMGIPALYFANTRPIDQHRVLGVHQTHLVLAAIGAPELIARIGTLAARLNLDLPEVTAEQAARNYRFGTPDNQRLKFLLNYALTAAQREHIINLCFAEVIPGDEAEIAEDLYMSRDQLRDLAEAGELGSHAHDHVNLARLPEDELEYQIGHAQDLLLQWTGIRPLAISYPFGARDAYAPRVGRVAEKHGLVWGFTMDRARNTQVAGLTIGRFDCNDLPGGSKPAYSVEQMFDGMPDPTFGEMTDEAQEGPWRSALSC